MKTLAFSALTNTETRARTRLVLQIWGYALLAFLVGSGLALVLGSDVIMIAAVALLAALAGALGTLRAIFERRSAGIGKPTVSSTIFE